MSNILDMLLGDNASHLHQECQGSCNMAAGQKWKGVVSLYAKQLGLLGGELLFG